MRKFHFILMSLYLTGAQPTFADSLPLQISAQQANALLGQLVAIRNAADELAQSSGSYAAANISNTTLATVLPNSSKALVTPWGTNIIIGTPTQNQYPVTILQVPHDICVLAEAKLQAYKQFANLTPCQSNNPTDIHYTFTANP